MHVFAYAYIVYLKYVSVCLCACMFMYRYVVSSMYLQIDKVLSKNFHIVNFYILSYNMKDLHIIFQYLYSKI